jgi:uncharacterized OsmC-like protein
MRGADRPAFRHDQGRTFRECSPRGASVLARVVRRDESRRQRDRHVVGVSGSYDSFVDRGQLRTVQQPLKERYRQEPAAALVTLAATGTLGEGISCSVDTGRALAEAGLHPASGGDGSLLCSGDMLLEALVACAGVTMRAVGTSLGVAAHGTVRAEGDLDFRGTLGVDREAPVGFSAIRLAFELDEAVDQEQLDLLLGLTERYCVVYQTLISSTPISSTISEHAG